ncbi:hypothetical protein Hanom_Chr03g00229401 [Helianthus anomalus]
MEVPIYSRSGVGGDGLMGLGPEDDNKGYLLCLSGVSWWLLEDRWCWRTLIGAACPGCHPCRPSDISR